MASTTHAETRNALIAAAKRETATIEGLIGRKDAESRKTRLSAGARKANRHKEIREIELEMALEGEKVTPYQEAPTASRMAPMTQAEIETKITAITALISTKDTPDSVKHTGKQRIEALKKAAEARGYTL